MKKSATWKQTLRTKTRGTTGRFNKLNPCELCRQSAGAEYVSDDRCNVYGWGVTLCGKCAELTAALSDAEYATLAAREHERAAWGAQQDNDLTPEERLALLFGR
jgi:hypothetical protein